MVYGILGLINFAHGEVVMVGALVSLSVVDLLLEANLGIPAPLVGVIALLVAIGACMTLGFSIERIAYRPLRHAPRLAPLITAIGVSILLQTVAMLIWGRRYHTVPALIPPTAHTFAGATITNVQILIILASALIMAGLMGLVHFTRLGRAMRATAENPLVAGLMGVNINRIISATFVIGSALAAIAGVLVSSNYGIAHYYMGFVLGLKAFTAAVLGGIGNLPGAMVGGLLLGLIESLGAGYIGDLTGGFLGSHYQDVFAFAVLIMVLVFRPTGLLGERVSERA
jgi:branched-chain amino acid transport system permease protein